MNGPFSELAKYGRGGDTLVAHINPKEAALLKARGGSGTINPRTGLLEFWDPSDPGDSGPPSDPGASAPGNDMLPGEPNPDGTPNGPVNPGTFNPELNHDPGTSFYTGYMPEAPTMAPRPGFFQNPMEYMRQGFLNKMDNITQNPISSIIDLVTPGGLVTNMFGLPSPGSMVTGAVRSLTNYDENTNQMQAATGEPEGPAFDQPDNAGGGDPSRDYTGQIVKGIPQTLSAPVTSVPGSTTTPGSGQQWTQPGFDWTKYGYGPQQRFFTDFDASMPFGPGNGSQIMRGPFG